METDPIDDAAHPSQTHVTPGAADVPAPGDSSSGEEDIVDGRNPTQRKIDGEGSEGQAADSDRALP
jgi:hypothetical protein